MTEQPVIRKALLSDIDQMVMLLKSLFSFEADFVFDAETQRSGLERMLREDGAGVRCIFVAALNHEILGMCSIQAVVSTAEGGKAGLVEDMVVKQEWRGKGLGKELFQAVCRWAEQNNIKRLQLLADKTNDPALGFYKKLGWHTTQLICLRKTAPFK